MTLYAGFSETDITPPVGVEKIGWLKRIVSTDILGPLKARVAVFASDAARIAVVQLDTLLIAAEEVATIRRNIETSTGFPGANVMVAATHNHAGPAVARCGDVPKDEAYIAALVDRVVAAFKDAWQACVPAEIGFGHATEWEVAHNRRIVMRDGTVRTHGHFADPDALYLEGPVDPEVAVVAVRECRGNPLGLLVNFACHPTHHGGDTAIHPGYPGVLADHLRALDYPMTLFLNGASGNLHHANPCISGADVSAEEAGRHLAVDVQCALAGISYSDAITLAAASQTVALPYRWPSDAETAGTAHGAQRFIDSAIYDRGMPELVARIRAEGALRVEVQALSLGDRVLVGLPGEIFTEWGLQIKIGANPRHALVVSCANGHIGYVPTVEAFSRGGYETTFGEGSKLAPEAGQLLVKAALSLMKQ